MDPNNNNRPHLNFGYNERPFNNAAANNRAYPTTPSAFPQPIYQNQSPQDYVDAQNGAYGQGYFVQNQYAQQAAYAQQHYGQPNLQSPQPAYQSRMGYGANPNDGTNGLIQQFSNQDLNANRTGFFGRAASPAQRPRTAGNTAAAGQQQQPGHLAPPVPRSPRAPAENEELQRYPERFSENVHKRGKAAKELVNVFFNENIERARDRNMR
jgi:protein-serine/threonine kinase